MRRRQTLVLLGAPLTGGCAGLIRDPTPEPPEIRVVTEETAGQEFPATRIQSVGRDGVTVSTTIEVDNTANQNVGGEVERVDYTALWGETDTGPWMELGPGEIDSFDLPAGEVVRTTAETRFTEAQAVAELAVYLGSGETAYLRITGTASVSIGSLNTDVDFEEVKPVEL